MGNCIYCFKELDDGTESFLRICKTDADGREIATVAYVDKLTDRVIYLCDDARTDETVSSMIKEVHRRKVRVKCPTSRNDSPGILVDTGLGTLEVSVENHEFFEDDEDKVFVSFIPQNAQDIFVDITRVSTDGETLKAYCIKNMDDADFPRNPNFAIKKPDIDTFVREERSM